MTDPGPSEPPDISILLPYRDAGGTIDAALDGLLTAKTLRIEVLAVDDGSRDDGPARVRARAAQDGRVMALTTEGPGGATSTGIVAALQTARRAARASLLARMDADDVSLPGRLEDAAALLRSDPSLGACASPVRAVGTDGAPVGDGLDRFVTWQNGLRRPTDHRRDLFVESPLCHPATTFRRAAFDAVGGYRDGPFPEDYDLFLRLSAAGWGLAKTDRVGLLWRHRPGRLTFSDPRYDLEAIRRLKARHLTPWLGRDPRPFVIWGAGPTGRRFARALEEEIGTRPVRFVDIDPRKIGGVARRDVPIAGPDSLDPRTDRVLVAVGSQEARALIRPALLARGFAETADFLCVA